MTLISGVGREGGGGMQSRGFARSAKRSLVKVCSTYENTISSIMHLGVLAAAGTVDFQ